MDQILVTVLQNNGGDMSFADYMAAVRAAGGRPDLWLRAKHAGQIETYFQNGVHRVRLPQPQPQPAQ